MPADVLEQLREICLSLPEVTERLSHGAPTFFVRGKSTFVTAWLHGHHDHTFPHLWCAALPGVQESLVRRDSARFFRPPYVGHRGWVGIRLDVHDVHAGIDWDEIAELCDDAYRAVAPKRLLTVLDEQRRHES
jgi:hypothetical protein